ncbi:hypothetical protein ABIE26_000808 [Pedobacter africanus]|uniref:Uncharacterized protein n=1 Tax=Pedobacter africanus TaxID=151894 RepID=A0ACC6KU28_9SPHI|nr:hypothetical protein [Pedobacter africanus]MDR6782705.1 hypothetical protein [Pedobacter africanus]
MLRKKILLPLLALAIVATAMAFKQANTPKIESQLTEGNAVDYYYPFHYIGPSSPTSFSDYTNPNNYVILAPGEGVGDYCESGDDALCIIMCQRTFTGGSWKPDFSDTSWGNTQSQLYNYYWYGAVGFSLYTKALY